MLRDDRPNDTEANTGPAASTIRSPERTKRLTDFGSAHADPVIGDVDRQAIAVRHEGYHDCSAVWQRICGVAQ